MKTFEQHDRVADTALQRGRSLHRQLKHELKAAGCFAPAPLLQLSHMFVITILFAGAYILLLLEPATGVRGAALLVLAFSSVQAGYIAHEAGHGAITRKRWLATSIGQFFNTFLTALCYSHFQKIHICHHSHCNERDQDVDLQSGLFSLYPEAKEAKTSLLGRLVTRHQAYLIWPLVSLQGFTLKIDSLVTLRQNPQKTRVDQAVLVLHLLLWFGLPVYLLGFANATLNYALMTWLIGPYLGAVFLVNHIGTHVVRPGERMPSFIQKLTTTRNLGSTRVDDLFFGGLNNHVEHHIFPSIPSAHLRRARIITRRFCQQHELCYQEMSWYRAAGEVFRYLQQIARQPARSAATTSREIPGHAGN